MRLAFSLVVVRMQAYFGCVDLKYDAAGAVRILELGDGHTSAFTGEGALIPKRFAELRFLKSAVDPVLDAIIENKALTHQAVLDAGYAALRPRAAIFPKTYSAQLVRSVWEVAGSGPCVLKLCARQRSCGVVVVEHREELDEVLRIALGESPPQRDSNDCDDSAFVLATRRWATVAAEAAARSGLAEQLRYWASDEHGHFLAEELCASRLVPGPKGRLYDGTLRVGFAVGSLGAPLLLGAYWKLPDVAADDCGAIDARCISHTRGGAQTAPCSSEDADAVWSILQPALAEVVRPQAVTPEALSQRCSGDPLLLASALVRIASGLDDAAAAEDTLREAEAALAEVGRSAAAQRVRSYARRTRGAVIARSSRDWARAAPHFDAAIAVLPENAAAAYLHGMARFWQRDYSAAAQSLCSCVSLDPDFACAYCQLATCCLLLGDAVAAADIVEALLSKHMRLASAFQHLAMALYTQESSSGTHDPSRRARAADALRKAQALQRGKSWSKEDDEMLAMLESGQPWLPQRNVRTWLFHSWRS